MSFNANGTAMMTDETVTVSITKTWTNCAADQWVDLFTPASLEGGQIEIKIIDAEHTGVHYQVFEYQKKADTVNVFSADVANVGNATVKCALQNSSAKVQISNTGAVASGQTLTAYIRLHRFA